MNASVETLPVETLAATGGNTRSTAGGITPFPVTQSTSTSATQSTATSADAERSRNSECLKYTDIADAPPMHRQVAHLLIAGHTPESAAVEAGMHPVQIERMLRHQPFLNHLSSLQGRIALETARQHGALASLFSNTLSIMDKAVTKLSKRLDSEDCDTSETTQILDKVHAVSQATADRLPGRAFTKVTRSEAKTLGVLEVQRPPAESNPRGAILSRFNAIEAEAQTPTVALPPVGDLLERPTPSTAGQPSDEVNL